MDDSLQKGRIIENKVKLEVASLLPTIPNEQDACLDRLVSSLQSHSGINHAHISRDPMPASLCLHFNPETISPQDVIFLANKMGGKISNRYHHKKMELEGLDCSDCALVIEHRLIRLDGVLDVQVDYTNQKIQVGYDSRIIRQREIKKRIRQLGYGLKPNKLQQLFQDNREFIVSILGGVMLLIAWIGEQTAVLAPQASLSFYIAAYLFAGLDITRHAISGLRKGKLDTDSLMLLAALGAASLGAYAEGALLLFLFSLGHALEDMAMNKTRSAVNSLASFTPKQALLRQGGLDQLVPIERVKIEDLVVVRPGERIPVDGVVESGRSAVNQSTVTGESLPVDKWPGERLFAGTLNGDGALIVQVTRLSKDSTLARVMKMVEQAQEKKSSTQNLVDRIMQVYVPTILLVVLALILIPTLLGQPFAGSFYRAMTVLVAASPCALALGAPSAFIASITQAARNGVLVKGGVFLERMSRLRALAFDKTGTLTKGQPSVTDILTTQGYTVDLVLSYAAAVESHSSHPIAQAISKEAEARKIVLSEARELEALSGWGVRAKLEGRTVWVGNDKTMSDRDFRSSPHNLLTQATLLEEQGKSVSLVGIEDMVIGLIAVSDVIRPEAIATLAELERLGINHTVMMSGDNIHAAAYIARQIGLKEYRAELMPEDKSIAIEELQKRFGDVGMVGDGINDAPALAHADVGIAMGGAASDIALETADVVLMSSDLIKLPFAIGLSRATQNVVLQNLTIAFGVMAGLVAISLANLAGIGWVALLHEGSTLLVVLNAMRLLDYSYTPINFTQE